MLRINKNKLYVSFFTLIMQITYSQCELHYKVDYDTIKESKDIGGKVYLPETENVNNASIVKHKFTNVYFIEGFNNECVTLLNLKKVVFINKITTNDSGYAKILKLKHFDTTKGIKIKVDNCMTDIISIENKFDYILINYEAETQTVSVKLTNKTIYYQ